MSHHINYSSIGWERFEDLCNTLWFDEGYADIQPYGRTGEGGRDAVFVDQSSGDLTIFQYKRWGSYRTNEVKSMIKEAAEKVAKFSPKVFILNSSLDPNPQINDWIPTLSSEVGFEVRYRDRSWIDFRLDNRRQDLRRQLFGTQVEHHSLQSLIETSSDQIDRALTNLSLKFTPDIFVRRGAKSTIDNFLRSNKLCLAVVDRTGYGKTNLICGLAEELRDQKVPSILIRGDTSVPDDQALTKIVCIELGYHPEGIAGQIWRRSAGSLLNQKHNV